MAGTGAAPSANTRGFAALRVPKFRLYLAGSMFSRLGDNMEAVTRSWLVWQLTESPFWLGLMVFFHWLPNTTLAMFAGVLADRVDNRKLIMYCESLYFISAAGVGVLTLLGVVNVWQIGALLIVHGLSGAISNPSRQVFIHDTVGKEKLMSAVSLTNSLFQCMTFVGPAIAGLLIAALGVGTAYVINALAFLPAIVIMAIIRVEKQHHGGTRLSAVRSLAEGMRYVRGKPVMMSMLAMATVPALLTGDALSAMMPVFATQVLNVGVEGMGFLLSANGLGAISAALFISYMGKFRRRGLLIVIAGFLWGILLVAFSFSSSYLLSLALLVLAGAASVTSHTLLNVSLQLGAADNLRGRVMGLYSMGTLGVRSFHGPLIGGFATAAGAPFALAFLGGVVALAVIVITAFTPNKAEWLDIGRAPKPTPRTETG